MTTESVRIGLRVTPDEADAVALGHRNLHHGARTACQLYPYIREAVIEEVEKLMTADERVALSKLDLPASCDKSMLAAICSTHDELQDCRIELLRESQVIVLVDLIRQDMLVSD